MGSVSQSAKAAEFVLHDIPGTESAGPEDYAARIGSLNRRGQILETPNFLAITSRGVVPHLTPDVLTQHTQFEGVHMAIEDCRLFTGFSLYHDFHVSLSGSQNV